MSAISNNNYDSRFQSMSECRFCKKEGIDLKHCGCFKFITYCNSECQTKDWNRRHKVVHLNIMKARGAQKKNVALECCKEGCEKSSLDAMIMRCSKCYVATYCSKDCQIQDYREFHKAECSRMSKEKLMNTGR